MKKSVYIIGIVSSILVLAGAVLKILHLPGAAILLILGVFIAIVGFLPLFFYTSYKEHQDKKSIIPPLLAFLATALLVTGALFKTLHLPSAREILLIGSIVMLGGFLPVYLVSVFRKSQETRNWSAYLLLLILFGAVILMISTSRISSAIIDKYEIISNEAKLTKEYFSSKADSTSEMLIQKNQLGGSNPFVNQITIKANEIHQIIDEIKKELLSVSGNISEEKLKNADSDRACFLVLQKKEVNVHLIQKVDEYKSFLIQNTLKDKSKKIISVYLANNERFENLPLIFILTKLNELDRNIAMAEYESLTSFIDDNK